MVSTFYYTIEARNDDTLELPDCDTLEVPTAPQICAGFAPTFTTIYQQHPNGYEWCVNAPVIDGRGLMCATSEDGNVYSIPQGHSGVFTTPQQKIFLLESIGAAYTLLSIDDTGREYSQNNGNLFVLGQ